MMLPHILSVFAAVSKFYDMTMYVLYKKYLFYMGKTGASTLTSIECGNESVTGDAVNYM